MKLSDLAKAQPAIITDICEEDPALASKLREIGFAEEDEVEITHYGPLAARPLCVRLNQTMIALRLVEARAIEVSPL